MTSAWDKAMRGSAGARVKFEVFSVAEIRPGVFEAKVRSADGGYFNARLYPNGVLESGTRELRKLTGDDNPEAAKIRKAIERWKKQGGLGDVEVAKIIAQQIGNRAFQMIGARDLMGDDKSLTFRIGRNAQGVTHIKVTLDPSDTYTMQFLKVGRAPRFEKKVLSEASDIYADNLRKVIESKTGMYTSL